MVQKHGFDGAELHRVLAQAERYDWIIRLMDAQAPTTRPPTGPDRRLESLPRQVHHPGQRAKRRQLLA